MTTNSRIPKWLMPVAVVAFAAVFVVLIYFPPAAKRPETDAKSTVVNVRIGSFFTAIDYAPFLVAKARGAFEEAFGQQAKVSYVTFESLPTINESFATNRVDIVFEAEPPALIGRAAGIDVLMAGVSCSLVQEIIVPAGSSIKTVSDLNGKKVAVLAGTSSHYGVIKTLREAGMDPKRISILDMAPPDAKAAFGTGAVDAWAVWPPWVEQETVPGNARALPGASAYIHSIMAIRGGFAKEHPALAKKAIEVLASTKKWLIANPKEGQSILSKELDLPLNVVVAAWPKHDWAATISEPMLQDIQAKADFLKDTGLIERSIRVNPDFLLNP
jgi:sulfonate transport system substrate-binding protein